MDVKSFRRLAVTLWIAAVALISDPMAVIAQEKPIGILLAAGDIATCSTNPIRSGKATADLVKQEIERAGIDHPGVEVRVLALGDLAYDHGSSDSVKCFDATWGQFKNRMLPVPGNHEYETKNATPYFDYFKGTLNALNADKKTGSYAVDFPPTGPAQWRLIALNSNMETGSSSAQIRWLQEQLQQAQGKKCVLAFSHAFYYSSGHHGHGGDQKLSAKLVPLRVTETIFDTLYHYKASAFLSGHDHIFEQLGRAKAHGNANDLGKSAAIADGVRSFVVGTGGKRLYSADYRDKWAFTEAYDLSSYGILKIELYPTSYKWQFISTTTSTTMRVIKNVNSDTCNLAQ